MCWVASMLFVYVLLDELPGLIWCCYIWFRILQTPRYEVFSEDPLTSNPLNCLKNEQKTLASTFGEGVAWTPLYMIIKYTAKLLFTSQYLQPNFVVPISRVKNPCATHDEVPMGYHQLLVCHEGNFVVPLKVAPWWPTGQGSHAVALLCAPCYRVPSQYLYRRGVPPLPSSRVATSMVLRSYSENSNLAVYLLYRASVLLFLANIMSLGSLCYRSIWVSLPKY